MVISIGIPLKKVLVLVLTWLFPTVCSQDGAAGMFVSASDLLYGKYGIRIHRISQLEHTPDETQATVASGSPTPHDDR
jgi:hypothetical protein